MAGRRSVFRSCMRAAASAEPEPVVPHLARIQLPASSGTFGSAPYYATDTGDPSTVWGWEGIDFTTDIVSLELRDFNGDVPLTNTTGRKTLGFFVSYAGSGDALIAMGIGDDTVDTNFFATATAGIKVGAAAARDTAGLGSAFNRVDSFVLDEDESDLAVVASNNVWVVQLIVDFDANEVEVYIGSAPETVALVNTIPYTASGTTCVRVLAHGPDTHGMIVSVYPTQSSMENVSFDLMGADPWVAE